MLCAGTSLNVAATTVDFLYVGDDSYSDFLANGGPQYVDELVGLQRNGIVDPLDGKSLIKVEVFFSGDGASAAPGSAPPPPPRTRRSSTMI